MSKQAFQFQAETKELLDLMIHSLYSHKEIFLRELISNASDAIEKLKFESLTQPSLAPTHAEFEIRLSPDAEQKTLSISDNGIGMTKDEVIKNIGTIAHSGTKAFLKAKQEIQKHPELIGQFGVGFYSAFMVADRVSLHTQKAGETTGVLWESDGTGSYTIEEKPREAGAGTTVTLYLKTGSSAGLEEEKVEENDEEAQDFTNPFNLKQVVKKYSDFVAYPIKMRTTRTEKKGDQTETVIDDETLNSRKALWLRSPSDITGEEYNEFYRHISHDWQEPVKTVHYKAEGTMEFSSIFYFPKQRPFDYYMRDHKAGLSLYVKRVFIKSDCEELIPPYLRFVKGVVDSDDVSLNVSREMLQQDRQITRIRKALTGKILGSLKEFLEQDRANYEKFWEQFGVTIKEGVPSDPQQVERLQDLLLFQSTAASQVTTLAEYIGRMKPDQKAIYYLTGETLHQLNQSPYLEKPRMKGFEVLLMTDRVDAWVATHLSKYRDKPLQSVSAEDLDLTNDAEKEIEKQKQEHAKEKLSSLLDVMKGELKEKVKDVRISDRLTESPVCLVAAEHGMTAHMERILESMGHTAPKAQRVLEINAQHPVFEKMLKAPTSLQHEWTEILYDQALLNEGSQIDNPQEYSRKIANLMISASKDF